MIAHESTARKTTVCSNDPATCESQVSQAVLFFAMFFQAHSCSILPSKSKSFPFLSSCILTMIYTKSFIQNQ